MNLLPSDVLQFTRFLPEEVIKLWNLFFKFIYLVRQFFLKEKSLLFVYVLQIWEMILNIPDSTTDKRNCSNAAPFFRDLLLKKRTLFLFPEVLDILLDSQRPNSKRTASLTVTDFSEQNAMQIDFVRMKNEWEVDQLADKFKSKNEIGCSYECQDNKLDMEQGWLKMETGWETLQGSWNFVQDTLEYIQRNNLEGTWDWERKINIRQGEIHDIWKQMRFRWGIMGCKKDMKETVQSELDQIRSSLRSIQNNVAQVKNIQEWALTLPNLRLVCKDSNKEIGKRMTSNLPLLPNL